MFKAETPGPMKDSKMTPRIAQTAKGLWAVYFGVTLACVFAYRWGGMSWFDAVCHTFSTMGLGGFSTHDASFGHFDSPTLELPIHEVDVFLLTLSFVPRKPRIGEFVILRKLRDGDVTSFPFLAVVFVPLYNFEGTSSSSGGIREAVVRRIVGELFDKSCCNGIEGRVEEAVENVLLVRDNLRTDSSCPELSSFEHFDS